ncbi:MAG: ATP-dependent DNA helicase [Gammaproteobacteria bacterium]|jgi:ATP-dependent DNA helicase DinG|nr:ATP-dependent DNA helicase [Gammaproteobacteria bacterium]
MAAEAEAEARIGAAASPAQQAAVDALAPDGALAQGLPHFHYRPQQQAMATRIAAALESGATLICEAGTGTGKTFAYLVPALLSRRKVVISTGTRNLQDQLFQRDIPLIREALGAPIQIALLKGRANYLCRYRLDLALAEPDRQRPEARRHLQTVRDWGHATRLGDIAELAIPEQDPVWPVVTSTADNCLGQNCPDFSGCHLLEARRRAQAAEVVVVNHHLLCADLALRDEGFGEVLPGADAFIVDEAHQLPEIAASFFGSSISARQLVEIARDIEVQYRRDADDLPALPHACDAVRLAVAELRLHLRESLGSDDRRGAWQEIEQATAVQAAIVDVSEALAGLERALEPIAERSRGLEQGVARVKSMRARLDSLIATAPDAEAESVRWFDLQGRGFRFHQTPLEVSEVFRTHREQHQAAWVFTSATLAVGDSFDHFALRIGCERVATAYWNSPFDYQHQALLYCPTPMPEPSQPGYTQRVAEVALAALEISRGRAFLLFTSHRALRAVAAWLEPRIGYPLLVQGSAPRAELIARFRALGNAVLLGTASFWEGIDVRGEALSCVIIDKLPFSSPADPVLQARVEALRRQGGNPFRDLQLPQAVIALKQGAGRLIRDPDDRGVLVVCDPRLTRRGYGRVFLDSLPPMARTDTLDDLRAFFAAQPAGDACTNASISS